MITPGSEALIPLQPLINLHEYEDEYQDTVNVLGYMLDEEHDVLYFHKGIDINYLKRLLVDVEFKFDPYDPYQEMRYQFEEVYAPRDEDQEDAIDFISGEHGHKSNINDSQIFLVLATGAGKTYCAGYGAGVLGLKTLIIMHRDNLRSQWKKSLHDLNGYTSKEVYELTSSEELEMIANGELEYDYDIYLMTHATFRAGCNRIRDCEKIRNITKNLHIGLKIIDEAHLEFRDTLIMDFLFNVKRNLYLTATDGRSSKDENAIFKHVFANTTFYRRAEHSSKNHPDKWVEYITVDINTHVPISIYKYRVNGGRGMSAITYGKWVIQYDKKKTHFKVCKEILKEIFTNESTAKVIVFMPLIDLCTDCAEYLSKELNDDDAFDFYLEIRTVNSHNSKSENEYNKKADVIVTTIQSLGTGSDIKGITDIINCSPIVSKIVVKQVLGRIRYIAKPCHYYDIVDQSVQADVYWWKSRSRTLKALTTKYTHLTWLEDKGDEQNDSD
jgi:hypothetical protein